MPKIETKEIPSELQIKSPQINAISLRDPRRSSQLNFALPNFNI